MINVDPRKDPPGDGTRREELIISADVTEESGYFQIVFFDHVTRRKH